MNPYYANKVRHQLQDVLRMTDANPAFVTAWAEAIAHAARNESDTLTARRIEHHGVLVDRDGTVLLLAAGITARRNSHSKANK